MVGQSKSKRIVSIAGGSNTLVSKIASNITERDFCGVAFSFECIFAKERKIYSHKQCSTYNEFRDGERFGYKQYPQKFMFTFPLYRQL